MKRFLRNVVKLLLIVLLAMAALDIFYSTVFHFTPPRTKTQFLLSLKNTRYDYVFIGSSRVKEHVNIDMVRKATGKTAINLGVNGGRPDDFLLQLRLLVSNKVKIKKLFLQVDYTYNDQGPSRIVGFEALPFIHTQPVITKHLRESEIKFDYYYWVPFYRYLDNDYPLGFRAMFLSIFVRKKIDFYNGFEEYNKPFTDTKVPMPTGILSSNRSYNKIDSLARANNIEVAYFTAPMCDDIRPEPYMRALRTKFPKLHDYSASIKDLKYYRDCRHLNGEGATLFTQKLIDGSLK